MLALRAWSTFLALVATAVCTSGQSVISTHSGVIYYFEGSVFLGDQQLESHLGKFPSVPEGAELRTAQGYAEVLLTPGVFLRMGEKSSIRMLSNDLAHTRVELLAGSVIVDSAEADSGKAVTLAFKNWQARATQAGIYRLDSDPPHLWALNGGVDVFAGTEPQPIRVKQGMDLPFAAILTPERSNAEPVDGLSDWAKGRSDSIAADNAVTQQIDADPASQTAGLDGFTYFPVVGLSPNLYSSVLPSEPGFYSTYLPGYTSAPLFLLIVGRTIGPRFPASPIRIRIPGRIGSLPTPHPVAPLPALVTPHAGRTAPHTALRSVPTPHAMPHAVGHR